MIRYFLGTRRSENVEHVNIFCTNDIDLRKCVYNIVHRRSSQTRGIHAALSKRFPIKHV